jgi:GNAT superfamily N-acetyltransferase
VPTDAAPLALILGDWVRETGWMPVLHSREADAAFLRGLIDESEVTVAEGEAPLGFLALAGEEVLALYLAPEARGRGIGAALLSAAKAGKGGLSLWVFEANPRAVAFYLREGFEVERRTDGEGNGEGLPDLRMSWKAAR